MGLVGGRYKVEGVRGRVQGSEECTNRTSSKLSADRSDRLEEKAERLKGNGGK